MGKGYGIEQWEIEEMDELRKKQMDPLFDNHPAVVEQRKQTAALIEKLRCEMCADSKWKSACPECDGTGYYTVPSQDRA